LRYAGKKIIGEWSESLDKKILKGAEILDLGLFLKKENCLVIADLHLGYEEMLNKQGVFVPRFNFSAIKERLEEKVFKNAKPSRIIVNGDLKHEFGIISEQEWREVIDMLRFLQQHCNELVLVRGNHDRILGPIAKWEGMEIAEEGIALSKGKVFVTHGHAIAETKEAQAAETIIIAHEHPAVGVREGVKRETYKCFLKGKFKGRELVVIPSLNQVAVGTDMLREQAISSYLQRGLLDFKCWAVEDKPYYFGRLKNLQ
jgi:hypothetical protein